MAKENNLPRSEDKLMIISRCLSPPDENPQEIIYTGKPIETKEILRILGEWETARKYFYGISTLTVKKEKKDKCPQLEIYKRVLDYDEISKNYIREGEPSISRVSIIVNNEVINGLAKLLSVTD